MKITNKQLEKIKALNAALERLLKDGITDKETILDGWAVLELLIAKEEIS